MGISITPELVSEEEVRSFVSPYLETSVMSSVAVKLHIVAVEDFVKKKFYANGTLPTDARIPVLLLVVSKIMREPHIVSSHDYGLIARIGDLTFDTSIRNKSPYEQSITYEEMALQMLRQLRSGERFKVDLIEY